MTDTNELVHGAPHEGKMVTPCCGVDPMKIPADERMTTDDAQVTCTGAPSVPTTP